MKSRLVFLACLLALLPACTRSEAPAPKPGVPVEVVRSRSATVPFYLDALGRAVASAAVNVTPQVTGELLEVHFEQGSAVRAGQLLFTIDPRKYAARVKEAEGHVEQARAELEVRTLKLERNRGLAEQDFVSRQQYDQLAAQVAEAEGGLASAEGQLATARINLDFTQVRAPVSGVAGLYQVDVGNIVNGTGFDTLTTIETIDPMWVDLGIPGSQLAEVRRAMKDAGGALSVELHPLTSTSTAASAHTARVAIADNKVSNVTGTVTFRARVANPNAAFWPGQPLRGRLLLRELKDAVLVPNAAIGTGQAGSFVFVMKDGKAHQVAVELGQRQGDEIVIRSGVAAGADVITTGRILLSDGAAVRIAPASTPAAQPTPGSGRETKQEKQATS